MERLVDLFQWVGVVIVSCQSTQGSGLVASLNHYNPFKLQPNKNGKNLHSSPGNFKETTFNLKSGTKLSIIKCSKTSEQVDTIEEQQLNKHYWKHRKLFHFSLKFYKNKILIIIINK